MALFEELRERRIDVGFLRMRGRTPPADMDQEVLANLTTLAHFSVSAATKLCQSRRASPQLLYRPDQRAGP